MWFWWHENCEWTRHQSSEACQHPTTPGCDSVPTRPLPHTTPGPKHLSSCFSASSLRGADCVRSGSSAIATLQTSPCWNFNCYLLTTIDCNRQLPVTYLQWEIEHAGPFWVVFRSYWRSHSGRIYLVMWTTSQKNPISQKNRNWALSPAVWT